jgi:hypothetical protein
MTRIFNRPPFLRMTEAFGRVAGESWDCASAYVYDKSAENTGSTRLPKKIRKRVRLLVF